MINIQLTFFSEVPVTFLLSHLTLGRNWHLTEGSNELEVQKKETATAYTHLLFLWRHLEATPKSCNCFIRVRGLSTKSPRWKAEDDHRFFRIRKPPLLGDFQPHSSTCRGLGVLSFLKDAASWGHPSRGTQSRPWELPIQADPEPWDPGWGQVDTPTSPSLRPRGTGRSTGKSAGSRPSAGWEDGECNCHHAATFTPTRSRLRKVTLL